MTTNRAVMVGRWTLGVGVALAFLWRMLSAYGNRGLFAPDAKGPHRPLNPLDPALIAPPAAVQRKAQIADSVILVLHRSSSAFDSVFTAAITVTNRTTTAVKDLRITCDALSDAGAAMGHAGTTLPDLFPAQSTKTVPKVTLGFLHQDVASARCSVVDFTVAG